MTLPPQERSNKAVKVLYRTRKSYKNNLPFMALLLDFVESNTTPSPARRQVTVVDDNGNKSKHARHYLGKSSFKFLKEFRAWLSLKSRMTIRRPPR